ncbi:MAG TPA: DUF3459 domain-containing protein, partial [Solirubrobacteraceae bacterium]|nr:DUF3459 domain-containing protein [Solirubrobacteraceae bacterium]
GRRREFAAFAEFAHQEVPDPQDPATFERSKLTRRRDEALASLYSELLAVRRELPPGLPDAIEWDEDERWLKVRRGNFMLVMNFSDLELVLAGAGDRLRLATSPTTAPTAVAPVSGALLEGA